MYVWEVYILEKYNFEHIKILFSFLSLLLLLLLLLLLFLLLQDKRQNSRGMGQKEQISVK